MTTTVKIPKFTEYVEAFQAWIESLVGSIFSKDLDGKTVEGKGGVNIDFLSKQAAIKAYNSSGYEELTKIRWAKSNNTNITINDSYITH